MIEGLVTIGGMLAGSAMARTSDIDPNSFPEHELATLYFWDSGWRIVRPMRYDALAMLYEPNRMHVPYPYRPKSPEAFENDPIFVLLNSDGRPRSALKVRIKDVVTPGGQPPFFAFTGDDELIDLVKDSWRAFMVDMVWGMELANWPKSRQVHHLFGFPAIYPDRMFDVFGDPGRTKKLSALIERHNDIRRLVTTAKAWCEANATFEDYDSESEAEFKQRHEIAPNQVLLNEPGFDKEQDLLKRKILVELNDLFGVAFNVEGLDIASAFPEDGDNIEIMADSCHIADAFENTFPFIVGVWLPEKIETEESISYDGWALFEDPRLKPVKNWVIVKDNFFPLTVLSEGTSLLEAVRNTGWMIKTSELDDWWKNEENVRWGHQGADPTLEMFFAFNQLSPVLAPTSEFSTWYRKAAS
jgi:hypothetical protein